MSRIDPSNVIVMVRDSSDAVVRIGICNWRELREVVHAADADDRTRFKEIETQVGKAMRSGVAPS